ncbi:MAG: hypothetical protein AB1760_15935 [Pseudomonadota bacterium]
MLWILQMIAFFAYRTIAIGAGAKEVSVLSDEELANVLLIMMVFAFLSLILGSRLNRLTNIIAGSVFVLIDAIMLIDGLTAYTSARFNLMTGAELVFAAAIVWFAVRWPKTRE